MDKALTTALFLFMRFIGIRLLSNRIPGCVNVLRAAIMKFSFVSLLRVI